MKYEKTKHVIDKEWWAFTTKVLEVLQFVRKHRVRCAKRTCPCHTLFGVALRKACGAAKIRRGAWKGMGKHKAKASVSKLQ